VSMPVSQLSGNHSSVQYIILFLSGIREKLVGLVGFGSLKQKVLSGEEQQVIYWTNKLFSIPENEEVM
jgi:hypothetical protein